MTMRTSKTEISLAVCACVCLSLLLLHPAGFGGTAAATQDQDTEPVLVQPGDPPPRLVVGDETDRLEKALNPTASLENRDSHLFC